LIRAAAHLARTPEPLLQRLYTLSFIALDMSTPDRQIRRNNILLCRFTPKTTCFTLKYYYLDNLILKVKKIENNTNNNRHNNATALYKILVLSCYDQRITRVLNLQT